MDWKGESIGELKEYLAKRQAVENLPDEIRQMKAQQVKAKSGIALNSMVVVKPRVALKPFRTFVEVEQPESEFLLRISDRGEVGLFPADGGVWKLEATRNVAAYFEEELKDMIAAGTVVVIR